MRIAVIVDKGALQRFARDTLDAVEGIGEVAVFSCSNTRLPKRWLLHGAYYALNLLSIRNPFSAYVPVGSGKKQISKTIEFASDYDGAWQRLPPNIIAALNSGRFDLILKFGMGLLRVPPEDQLNVPILSYHHGDPDKYRGRPAGFWEIADGAPVMGQMVQAIGNRLDAGRVLAYAETKVMPWSYRATLMASYRHSPLIINEAIRNLRSDKALDKPCEGRNCRLPSNSQVIAFSIRMAARFLGRLAYGAFVEKAWKVSTAPLSADALPGLLRSEHFPRPEEWTNVPIARRYLFYADPFFTSDPPGILVEALRRSSGIGEIVFIDSESHRRVSSGMGHMSYPSVARIAGREVVVPETGRWSSPLHCVLESDRLKPLNTLRIQDQPKVIDPTLVEHERRVYLFGNIAHLGTNALYLWWSETLDGTFIPHPLSPIRVSPLGSRMGGALVEPDGMLIRLGQDYSAGYGDGLIAFAVETLTPNAYLEREIGRIALADRKGPHTLNVREGELVFDWYVDRISPLAAVRRLRSRRSALEKSSKRA